MRVGRYRASFWCDDVGWVALPVLDLSCVQDGLPGVAASPIPLGVYC
ncbi:MAG: hypothetical protein FWD57_12985 [Polyangiaceae bacterium]|nr:hypothetical protein [Polyangiaceae bacterium]